MHAREVGSVVQPLAFTLRLRGEAVELDGGRFWAEARAAAGIEEALCRRELNVRADGSLVEAGVLSFGPDAAITFRARGVLGKSPDPHVRHGTAVLEVTGGRGRLAGARGFVTSNFLLADTGELTDHHLGLIFVDESVEEELG
jgi:hypothetical protein